MKLSTAGAWLADVVAGLDRAAHPPETSLAAAFVFGAARDGAADLGADVGTDDELSYEPLDQLARAR